jgi:hypothetical protein
MLEIRQAAVDSEMVDDDVGLYRKGIAKDDPQRLEEGFERVIRSSSAIVTTGTDDLVKRQRGCTF